MENKLFDDEQENPMDAVLGAKASGKTVTEKKETKKENKKDSGKKESSQNIFAQVIKGDILAKDWVLNNLGFIFFILFLLVLSVTKGYYGKQMQRDINELQTEVDGKTAEFVENKAKLEEMTSRYQLVQKLKERGLKETVNPAKVIRIKKKQK
jgi:cell division protein FtsL